MVLDTFSFFSLALRDLCSLTPVPRVSAARGELTDMKGVNSVPENRRQSRRRFDWIDDTVNAC